MENLVDLLKYFLKLACTYYVAGTCYASLLIDCQYTLAIEVDSASKSMIALTSGLTRVGQVILPGQDQRGPRIR